MEMFGKSEVTSKKAFDALNSVEASVSKTVYATDGQEDWQKWKDGSKGKQGLRAMKTSSRATPAFPLLGQWKAGEKSKGRFASAGESHWQAEEEHAARTRRESGHGDVGRYTAYENERRRKAIEEKMAGPEAKKQRTKPIPKASDAASGKSQGGIPGVTAPPELEKQKVEEDEEQEEVNPLYRQTDATSAIALEQVSNAMRRAGTTPAHRMVGGAQYAANTKAVNDSKFWAEASDPATGASYWYHKQTGATTWVNPDPTQQQAQNLQAKKQTHNKNASAANAANLPDCHVYMDVSKGGELLGRINFRLFCKHAPRTCENFRQLCTGEAGVGDYCGRKLHYRGCPFHRVIPGFMVQGGDFSRMDGTGGESIYGRHFEDEAFVLKHTKAGVLSMANSGPNSNSSQFFITLDAVSHLDGKHVVFGEVIGEEDLKVVKAMGEVATVDMDRPVMSQCLTVMNCGVSVQQPTVPKPKEKTNEASLHPDWYEVKNKNATGEHDKVYYVNRKTKATSWKKVLGSVVGSGAALHLDWYEVKNKNATGEHDKVYYVNRKTKATSWKKVLNVS